MVYYEPNDALVARYPGGSFGINLYEFSTEHFFSAEDGMPYSSIGVITHGVVTIKSAYAKVDIPTGGIFYISADEKYTSTWTGDPDVVFWGLHAWPPLDRMSESGCFAISEIRNDGDIDAVGFFEDVCDLLTEGSPASQMRASAMYFDLVSRIIDRLTPGKDRHLPEALKTVTDYIDTDYAADMSVPELSATFHLSESTVYRLFRESLGTTPVSYRNDVRIDRSLKLLRDGRSIEETASEVGFNSAVYFRTAFIKRTGMTPGEYRKSLKGIR